MRHPQQVDLVLQRLRERGYEPTAGLFGDHHANCPAHADQCQSLVVFRRGRGVGLYCGQGCSRKSIRKALGLRRADLSGRMAQPRAREEVLS